MFDNGFNGATRLTTSEVCRLMRISRTTLWRRVTDGRLPPPLDRGRENLFNAASIRRNLDEGPRHHSHRPQPPIASTSLKPERLNLDEQGD